MPNLGPLTPLAPKSSVADIRRRNKFYERQYIAIPLAVAPGISIGKADKVPVKQPSEPSAKLKVLASQAKPTAEMISAAMRSLKQKGGDDRLIAFCEKHRILLDSKTQWRMLPEEKQRYGHVVGLPGIYGKPMITNGVLCWLESFDGQDAIQAHYEWFQADPIPKTTSAKRKQPAGAAARFLID